MLPEGAAVTNSKNTLPGIVWRRTLSAIGAAVALLFAAGCATNQPVQQIGPGEYTLYRVDRAGIFGNATALRNSVLADASAFAAKQGKIAVPISAKSHPMGILGDFASFQYTFRLADKSDKAAAAIHLMPGTDVVVDGNGKVVQGGGNGGITAPPASAASTDRVDRMAADLTTLEKLKAQGIISQAEFDAEKKRILANP
jgi:hypothetical protein